MLDAIRESRVRLLSAEMEIGLAGMADRPLADTVVQIEQAGLVGDLRAWLGRDEAARGSRRDRGLLVAGTLADEAARTDRTVLQFLRRQLAPTMSGRRWSGGLRLGRLSLGFGLRS